MVCNLQHYILVGKNRNKYLHGHLCVPKQKHTKITVMIICNSISSLNKVKRIRYLLCVGYHKHNHSSVFATMTNIDNDGLE